MNYYERHLGDYARDTSHLTIAEHGAYTLLLDRYYATERPIPADQVHRLARARSPEEIKAVDDVLGEFFVLAEGLWRHSRCDAEIVKKEAKTKAARENGKTGGRPKKQEMGSENETHQKPTGLLMGSENETQEKPSEKLTRHQTPVTSNTPIPPAKTPGVLSARTAAVSLPTWLTTIKAMGEQPIPETDPVFDYAEQAGIPMDMMRLCWVEFRGRYSEPHAKRYKDWRSVYRKAVRGNWFKLWRATTDGGYVLTTEGQQAQRTLEAKQGVAA